MTYSTTGTFFFSNYGVFRYCCFMLLHLLCKIILFLNVSFCKCIYTFTSASFIKKAVLDTAGFYRALIHSSNKQRSEESGRSYSKKKKKQQISSVLFISITHLAPSTSGCFKCNVTEAQSSRFTLQAVVTKLRLCFFFLLFYSFENKK